MKSNFKIGDKVIFKKLSKEKYNEIYFDALSTYTYSEYLKVTKYMHNKVFIILDITNSYNHTGFHYKLRDYHNNEYYHLEELKPYFDIKTKIKFVKDLIKK